MRLSHWAIVKSCRLSEIGRRPSSVSSAARGVADIQALYRSSGTRYSRILRPLRRRGVPHAGRGDVGTGHTARVFSASTSKRTEGGPGKPDTLRCPCSPRSYKAATAVDARQHAGSRIMRASGGGASPSLAQRASTATLGASVSRRNVSPLPAYIAYAPEGPLNVGHIGTSRSWFRSGWSLCSTSSAGSRIAGSRRQRSATLAPAPDPSDSCNSGWE